MYRCDGYNLNNTYYETLNKNFKKALVLYKKELSHEELMSMIKSGDIIRKQIAILRLDNIYTEKDADILMNNLTGQDGKIREAVSFRLKEFLRQKNCHEFFLEEKYYDIFLNAIIDINGNICRNTIAAISSLNICPHFCNHFCDKLINLTETLTDEVNKVEFKDGKYKVNKAIFKLYWCLETIYEFVDCINYDKIKKIILKSKSVQEYTIREKTAKILSKINCDTELAAIKKELNNDANCFVRRYVTETPV